MELLEATRQSIIKVIGVGGGGCNAINHMCNQGIQGVDFMVCNTDVQSLEANKVINKIQLGATLTDGLGAGNNPEAGKNAALESIDDIKESLQNTKMVFITAGMGGGTGTGAAPVIASIAKEMGILTIGIVTKPFSFEGRKRKVQADEGINELRKHVDSLIVICNDKLRELYGDQKLSGVFAKADNVLTTAAKGIAEIITVTGYINVDFEDVKTVMKDSGVAIMGVGVAEGENRAIKAAEMAINSPLLDDNNIKGAKNILLYVSSGNDEISMDELADITDYIQDEAGSESNIIWGNSNDENLENKISVILVAAGLESDENKNENNIIKHNLNTSFKKDNDNNANEKNIFMENERIENSQVSENQKNNPNSSNVVKYELFKDELPKYNESIAQEKTENNNESVNIFDFTNEKNNDKKENLNFELVNKNSENQQKPDNTETKTFEETPNTHKSQIERINKLKDLSMKIRTCDGLEEIENLPAYKRRGVEIEETNPSNEIDISDSSISFSNSGNTEIKKGNSFLHDNVD